MSDLREAAEMALEFVDWLCGDDHSVKPKNKALEVRKALRQALAQPEQEPETVMAKYEFQTYAAYKIDGEIKIGVVPEQESVDAVNMSQERVDETVKNRHEPVALYVYKPTLPHGSLGEVADGELPWVYDQDPSSGYSARMVVYTAPPKREWVGLSSLDKTFLRTAYAQLRPLYHDKKENVSVAAEVITDWDGFFAAINDMLKEKNSG